MEKVSEINAVIKAYFEFNKSIQHIPAKDLMPQFIKAGIYPKDQKAGLPIRKTLRDLDEKNQLHQIPFVYAERKMKNTNWFFMNTPGATFIKSAVKEKTKQVPAKTTSNSRKDSDEHYVIDLCDMALGKPALRQHRVDFLLGDAWASGNRSRLPVDAYYPDLNMVIEYKEQQHSKSVKHFDKPDIMTVSGVHRGEQRRIYDLRRLEVLPKHGIKVIEISYELFDCTSQNKIIRNAVEDLKRIQAVLKSKR